MPTIYDIAKEAGVSPSTVATVLRGAAKKARISDLQAAHVTLVARKMGYRPNASARAMRARQFGAIALLQSSHRYHSYLPGSLADGIHDAIAQRDLHLMMARLADEQLTDETFVPKILRQWMCDGLLIDYINDIPQRLIDLIDHYRIPSIWINAKRSTDCVYPDDFGGSRFATQRLLEQGHRRIAYFRCTSRGYTTKSRHYSEIDRRDGYVAAMCSTGLQPWIVADGQTIPRPQLQPFLRELLSRPDRPAALVMYGTDEAVAAVLAATSMGLELGRDLTLLAFHGEAINVGGVAVPTMITPERDLGRRAVELLVEKIADPAKALEPVALPLAFADAARGASGEGPRPRETRG